jgi:hypothetical protein
MRHYSPAGAVCITSPQKKAAAHNSSGLGAVYPRLLASGARAFTARRIRQIFAYGFDNLLLSAAE